MREIEREREMECEERIQTRLPQKKGAFSNWTNLISSLSLSLSLCLLEREGICRFISGFFIRLGMAKRQ
jgi:hypothetical protein